MSSGPSLSVDGAGDVDVDVDVDPTGLTGSWAMARRIHDRRLRQHGQVAGHLAVSAHGDRLHWHESGELQWDGRIVPVTRDLYLDRDEDGDWAVFFADGRPFHRWRTGATISHPCRDDHYVGLITVSGDGRHLRTRWDVTGPAKDLRLVTRYRRTDATN